LLNVKIGGTYSDQWDLGVTTSRSVFGKRDSAAVHAVTLC